MINSSLIKWGARTLLAVTCVLSFVLMLNSSLHESAIMDELAHIPAGYGYVHNLDYRLNPEHPPALKALAALPLLFLHPNFPTDIAAWTNAINGQWEMGAAFLYSSHNDADSIVRWARLAPMLLTIGVALLIYMWAKRKYGPLWALLPSTLFALSPSVLAHGHYVTTDIAAAFGAVIASYFFVKFLEERKNLNLLWAGLAFGLAQLLKFSMVLLIPIFIVLVFILYVVAVIKDWHSTDRKFYEFGRRALKDFGATLIMFLIGSLLVIYPVYALFTAHYPIERQFSDTQNTLMSFANGPAPAEKMCPPTRCLADLTIWASGHQTTRPMAQYLLGVLMVMQRSSGGNTSYFLGQVSNSGSRLYFPAVYALKETLPTLLIVFIGWFYMLWRFIKRTRQGGFSAYIDSHKAELSWVLFIFIYWAYSMKSPLNIGLRHLMPSIPFIYLFATGGIRKWFMGASKNILEFITIGMADLKALRQVLVKGALLGGLVIWFVTEAALASPHYLSYFNEMAGGTSNGYRYVVDSNYDWGQDLLYLKSWLSSHPEVDKLALEYFGGGDPKYYMDGKIEYWSSKQGDPKLQGIHWFAVSINNLQNSIQPMALGQTRNPLEAYSWLGSDKIKDTGLGGVPIPDYRIGTSIFVYKL